MIRQAELTDFDAIARIREDLALDTDRLDDLGYRTQIQRAGFLLPTGLDREAFMAEMQGYSVAEQSGEVLGYAWLNGRPETKWDFWIDSAAEDIYFTDPHAYLEGIGVAPSATHGGIGTRMLTAIEERARERKASWLFSEIVVSPVTNIASMIFHERHGFTRVALSETHPYLGMNGFQSLLYGREL